MEGMIYIKKMFLFITAFMLSVSTIVSAFEDIDEMVDECDGETIELLDLKEN